MLDKRLAEEALEIILSGGADFAEIFFEITRNGSVTYLDGRVDKISDNTVTGVGMRAFIGTRTVFASTSDTDRAGLIGCARSLSAAIGEHVSSPSVILTPVITADAHKIILPPLSSEMGIRLELLRKSCLAASDYDKRIIQAQGNLSAVERTVCIANTEGLFVTDNHTRTRVAVSATASDGKENQTGSFSPGRSMGLELFDIYSPDEIGTTAAERAIVNLEADYAPAGVMTVAIENGFGGVIFHEACGHSLEASSVGIGRSQMCGKLGRRVANEKITAIDDGTIPNAWGSVNIDDEGTPTRKNILIENGILKGYMIDRLGSRRMGMPMTGSARRESYLYEATSRMTNTYIDNGPDSNDDIVASIDYGIYAKSMGGGSVNPLTGAFNFAVTEGYMVRNGKICEAVRGASLVGTGSEILQNIDMVGKNLDFGQGMCGSSSGAVPTDVGQPLIRVSRITVGGRK